MSIRFVKNIVEYVLENMKINIFNINIKWYAFALYLDSKVDCSTKEECSKDQLIISQFQCGEQK